MRVRKKKKKKDDVKILKKYFLVFDWEIIFVLKRGGKKENQEKKKSRKKINYSFVYLQSNLTENTNGMVIDSQLESFMIAMSKLFSNLSVKIWNKKKKII